MGASSLGIRPVDTVPRVFVWTGKGRVLVGSRPWVCWCVCVLPLLTEGVRGERMDAVEPLIVAQHAGEMGYVVWLAVWIGGVEL
jgi:hypothetical protein